LTLTHPLACTGAQDLRPLESAGGTGQKPSADRHPGDWRAQLPAAEPCQRHAMDRSAGAAAAPRPRRGRRLARRHRPRQIV